MFEMLIWNFDELRRKVFIFLKKDGMVICGKRVFSIRVKDDDWFNCFFYLIDWI